MLRLKSKIQTGFTIIELLIVIAIIGILATLVLTNFRGAQAKGRDTVRKNDVNSIYQKLEEYYNENNGYPEGDVTAANAATVFPGIDAQAVVDADGDAVSMTYTTSATAPTPNPDTGTEYILAMYSCTNGSAQSPITATCGKYVLSTFQETGADYTKQSLN
jgi:prepilin-type N-terminal cleavage/methylation domain-containing protein